MSGSLLRSALRRALSGGRDLLELHTGLWGRLTVSAPDRPVDVASLDPAEHADIARVLVPDAGAGGTVRGRQTGEREWLVEAAGALGHPRPLRVLVPVPMDLKVACGSGCSLSVVENRRLDLASSSTERAEPAEFRLDRVKSRDARVTSEAGSARLNLSRTLLQSLTARGRHGLTLNASMYQGGEVSLESADGLVAMETGAVYCRRCSLRGARASLHCGSAHGDFDVEAGDTGSVRLDSLEGSLRLRMLYGDVDLHLTRPRRVDLDLGEGTVRLGLQRPEPSAEAATSTLLLDVTASGIDLDLGLEHLGQDSTLFPLGPNAVRLVAEVPCGSAAAPATADAADCEAPSCTVRVLSGRVRLSLRSGSGLFARLVEP